MSRISIELDLDQAEAPLTVLRRFGSSEIAMLHEGIEWATFDKANTELCAVLRDVVEPSVMYCLLTANHTAEP